MNLIEEKNYEMLMEVLDALGLSSKNRELAEMYLDPEEEANKDLLNEAERQDFSLLDDIKTNYGRNYVEHLKKNRWTEPLSRYICFVTAVGGSTAGYVIQRGMNGYLNYQKELIKIIQNLVSRKQWASIFAEQTVWDSSNFVQVRLKELFDIGKREPEVLRQAMEFCYNDSDNAKVLLAGVYLHCVKPRKSRVGITDKDCQMNPAFNTESDVLPEAGEGIAESDIQSETGEGIAESDVLPQAAEQIAESDSQSRPVNHMESDDQIKSIVDFLEDNLVKSVPNLYSKGRLSDVEQKEIETFLLESSLDMDFPKEIYGIIQKNNANRYLLQLLSGAAFLAMDHSEGFLVFLRFMMAINLNWTIQVCRNIGDNSWFMSHLGDLLRIMEKGDEEKYISWCMDHKEKLLLRHAAKKYPEAIRRQALNQGTKDYQFLMKQVAMANGELHKSLEIEFAQKYQYRMAQELSSRIKTGTPAVRNYLLGEASVETLYPYVEQWRGTYCYFGGFDENLEAMRDGQDPEMYRRFLVIMGLFKSGNFFCGNRVLSSQKSRTKYNYGQVIDQEQIHAILDVFAQEGLAFSYQLEALEGICDFYYGDQKRAEFLDRCAKCLHQRKEAVLEEGTDAETIQKDHWKESLSERAKNGSAVVRSMCIQALHLSPEESKDILLSCSMDSSKVVRELLMEIYSGHKEWEKEMLAMLDSKKSQEREMAVRILKNWGVDTYRPTLEKMLEKEKSKKLRELLENVLNRQTEGEGTSGFKTADELVAEILKGGRKRKVSWAYESPFPVVHKTDKTEATEEFMQAILVDYADLAVPGVSKNAPKLAAELNPRELSAYMSQLFDKWLESGAEAKKKWVLYAVSIHGGDEIIPALYHQIQEWPKNSRGAMAAEAVKALALNGGPTALLLVDQISRKFKFRQVKNAAADALSFAASELGISREELEDRIVPDLGFGENLEQTFDYGTRSFRVALTSALELEVFDESGKKLKNLPAPGKRDDEEKAAAASGAFKQLKKQLKTVAANQRLRLEQVMSSERVWKVEPWKELFVKNPIMHQFAIGLIWGRYEDGALRETFRYMEDGSFNTVEEEEYELPENGIIGLIHPIELSGEILAAWKEQLSDYEIVQPIEQLERPIYQITDEEVTEKEMIRFGGRVLNGLSLSGKMLGQGWYRGSIEDAGCYYDFIKTDGPLDVMLEYSGASVGYENEDVTVYGVSFYPKGQMVSGYASYRMEKGDKRCMLGEVSPRYFSEIVLQVAKATASSQETLAYPACKNL
ncbi:DUF4132 domain-containing protein [Candidatus Ventrimonas sp. KK005]